MNQPLKPQWRLGLHIRPMLWLYRSPQAAHLGIESGQFSLHNTIRIKERKTEKSLNQKILTSLRVQKQRKGRNNSLEIPSGSLHTKEESWLSSETKTQTIINREIERKQRKKKIEIEEEDEEERVCLLAEEA